MGKEIRNNMHLKYMAWDTEFAKEMSSILGNRMKSLVVEILGPEEGYHEGEEGSCQNTIRIMDLEFLEEMVKENHWQAVPEEIRPDFVLSREPQSQGQIKTGDFGLHHIYKYQRVEALANLLEERYSKLYGKRFFYENSRDSQVIYFLGSSGGTGKTTAALGLAQFLARYMGKRTLYLSLEECPSTSEYFKFQNEGGLSSLLYQVLFKGNVQPKNWLCQDIYHVYTLRAEYDDRGLKELSLEEFQRFMDFLQEEGGFDYIIADGQHLCGEKEAWLLQYSNQVCLVEDWRHREKGEAYWKAISEGYPQVQPRIYRLFNFRELSNEDELEGKEENTDCQIIYLSLQKGVSRIIGYDSVYTVDIDREFGLGIKELGDLIMG